MKNKLNFGCGHRRYNGFYNVDIIKESGIDKSFDFDKFPYPLKDNQFDYVLLNVVLEHCIYPKRVLEELRRVCRDKAIIEIKSPYANGKSALCELDHSSHFSRLSFISLCSEDGDWDRDGIIKRKFKLIKNKSIPQRFIKWIPIPILNFLSTFLNSIYVDIHVILEVVKDYECKQGVSQ